MSRWLKIAIAVTVVWLIAAVVVVVTGRNQTGPISYALVWDRAGVQMETDGTWSVTNDLGHVVTVSGGELNTARAEAFSCNHEHSVPDRIRDFFGVGHDIDELQPATARGPATESLVDPGISPLGPVDGTEPSYCQVQVTYGGTGTTLALELSVRSPDGSERTISLQSSVVYNNTGPLLSVEGLPAPPDGLRVQVTRQLATLFDGLDFSESDEELVVAILRNIGAMSRYETAPRS